MMPRQLVVMHEPNYFANNSSQHLEAKQTKFVAKFAKTDNEVRDAQALRAYTFGIEYGVSFVNNTDGLDVDNYDAYCLHLNVYNTATGEIIATTRLLTGESAKIKGGFYSEQEFDLSVLLSGIKSSRILEVGRTCVHPEYRSGAVIAVLWSALAEYLLVEKFNFLIGCASISLKDQAFSTEKLINSLDKENFVSEDFKISSKRLVPKCELSSSVVVNSKLGLPPLLKAYLRMNAKIGSQFYFDEEFNCADVFIMLDVAHLTDRYAQRFLKTA